MVRCCKKLGLLPAKTRKGTLRGQRRNGGLDRPTDRGESRRPTPALRSPEPLLAGGSASHVCDITACDPLASCSRVLGELGKLRELTDGYGRDSAFLRPDIALCDPCCGPTRDLRRQEVQPYLVQGWVWRWVATRRGRQSWLSSRGDGPGRGGVARPEDRRRRSR
jgi:hypothetical protein